MDEENTEFNRIKEALFMEGREQGKTAGFLNFNAIRKMYPQLEFDVCNNQKLAEEFIRGFKSVAREG